MSLKKEILLINIPTILKSRFKRAVKRGMRVLALSKECSAKKIQVVLIYDPTYHLGPRMALHAYPFKSEEEITIIVRVGIFLFQQADENYMEHLISHTVAHEFFHVMRPGNAIHNIVTLKNSIIEEGIAVWLTAYFFGLPPEINPKRSTHAHMQKVWKKLQPYHARKIHFEKDNSIEIGVYELGYFVVSEYAKRNNSSIQEILEVERTVLKRFLSTLFTE